MNKVINVKKISTRNVLAYKKKKRNERFQAISSTSIITNEYLQRTVIAIPTLDNNKRMNFIMLLEKSIFSKSIISIY